jgi:hypothetical protein
VHPGEFKRGDLLPVPVSKPLLTQHRLLGLLLEQDLPFSFAESPRLRAMFSVADDRRSLSNYAPTLSRAVRETIRPQIQACHDLVLVFDEWSDGCGLPYLGLKVHGWYLFKEEVRYRGWCLGHVPLEEKTAEALSQATLAILNDYGICQKVTYVVSDTTAVMPATVRIMGKTWCPCWAHILNLMLGKIVECVRAEGLDELLNVVGRISRGSQWRKLLARHGEFTSTFIPSFCPTRWYSLSRLVAKSLEMWEPLREFAVRLGKGDAFDDRMLGRLGDLAEIVGTFANATASLESDEFGTLSRVYDWIFLIQEKCRVIGDGWEAVRKGWSAACFHWRQYLGDDEATPRIVSLTLSEEVTLRDKVVAASFLNPGCSYERSLSLPNQCQARDVVARALAHMQAGDLSAPGSAGSDPTAAEPRRPRPGFSLKDLQLKSAEGPVRSELDRFMALDRSEFVWQGDEFKLLDWWNAHKSSYPKLFELAIRFLSLPATSAAIERQFSKATKIHGPHRRSLTRPKLEALVFLKEHLDVFDPLVESEGSDGGDGASGPL